MIKQLKTLSTLSLVFTLVFSSTMMVEAQEIQRKQKSNSEHTISYSFYTDDLGYFSKYHGWQVDSYNHKWERNRDDRSSKFKIKYEEGKPKCFSFEAKEIEHRNDGVTTGEGTITSKGVYDDDGISAFQAREIGRNKYSYALDRQIKVAKTKKDSEARLYFDSNYTDDGKEYKYSFGYYTQHDQLIVHGDFPYYILIGSTIIKFWEDDLKQFLKLGCKNIEEFEQSGFSIVEKSLDDCLKEYEPLILYPAKGSYFTQVHYGDYFSGFLYSTPEEYDKIPESCMRGDFFGKTFTMVELAGGWAYYPKQVKSFYIVSKTSGLYIELKKQYLTEEQYEKYKDRLEYDGDTQRHRVKKADGSYLYVPDKIEETFVKTQEEIEKDKEELKKKQERRKRLDYLFDVYQKVQTLQKEIQNLPTIKIEEK